MMSPAPAGATAGVDPHAVVHDLIAIAVYSIAHVGLRVFN